MLLGFVVSCLPLDAMGLRNGRGLAEFFVCGATVFGAYFRSKLPQNWFEISFKNPAFYCWFFLFLYGLIFSLKKYGCGEVADGRGHGCGAAPFSLLHVSTLFQIIFVYIFFALFLLFCKHFVNVFVLGKNVTWRERGRHGWWSSWLEKGSNEMY